jgi:hypothetical protein
MPTGRVKFWSDLRYVFDIQEDCKLLLLMLEAADADLVSPSA